MAIFNCSKVGRYVVVLFFSKERRWCMARLIDVVIFWEEKVACFLSSSFLWSQIFCLARENRYIVWSSSA